MKLYKIVQNQQELLVNTSYLISGSIDFQYYISHKYEQKDNRGTADIASNVLRYIRSKIH